jgi:uncharacterized protein Smg (DUF494 family)
MPRPADLLRAVGHPHAQTREHVIERALAANGDGLTLEQLKLVVLMVLWNQQIPSSRWCARILLVTATARLPS